MGLWIAVAFCLLAYAYGHAVLLKPAPWWWAAERARPCGGAPQKNVSSATWPVGSNQSLTWWVIAGDGFGEVHANLNLRGDTNFTDAIPIELSQPIINAQKTFPLSWIVPDVQCTGPSGLCTMQFWTNSGGGWYSCTTINITCSKCQGGYPISQDDCVKATNLTFCPEKNGQNVMVPTGQTALQIDQLTQKTWQQNHESALVFSNGNSSECMAQYQTLMCNTYLSPCGNSSLQYSRYNCLSALDVCGLTQEHVELQNCQIFPNTAATQIGVFGAFVFTIVFSILTVV